MTGITIAFLRLYRCTVGPLFAGRCKYHPSCSQYAIDALRSHGFWRGSILAGWRLARCNPWSHGGTDYAEDQTLFQHRRPSTTTRPAHRT